MASAAPPPTLVPPAARQRRGSGTRGPAEPGLENLGEPGPRALSRGRHRASEPRAAAAGGGVQNLTPNESTRVSKWALLDAQRTLSARPRNRECLSFAVDGTATISRRDGQLALSGLAVCGSRTCANCGPRIQAARRDEIALAVTAAALLGWRARFLTLTLRHRMGDGLAELLHDGLAGCWRALTQSGTYKRAARRHDVAGFIRVTETKHGAEHGWHPHIHALVFFRGQEDDAPFWDALLERWKELTRAAGYAAASAGLDVRDVTDRDVDQLAGYFTKQGAESLAWELTATDTKTRGQSLTPHELMALAAAGDEHAARLFREYETATEGVRLIAWSPALRKELRQPAPVDNLEAAAVEPPAAPVPLVCMPGEAWKQLRARTDALAAVALLVEADVPGDALAWWLRDRGITASPAPDPAPAPALRSRVLAPPGAPPWLALPEEHEP